MVPLGSTNNHLLRLFFELLQKSCPPIALSLRGLDGRRWHIGGKNLRVITGRFRIPPISSQLNDEPD
jgi:hypothetical protein